MFIEINNRILDKKKLEREQLILKKAIEYEFHDTMKKYGFKKKKGFYEHEEAALKCIIKFTRKQNRQ
jgi:hypothetical protein